MTLQPRVTAIITCMTDAERPFVREGLLSVVAQTVTCAIRLYVRHDNQWIDRLIEDIPEVELCRVPPMNSATVRNLGVQEARSEFIAFLDSDDVWLPDKTERQLAIADDLGVPFVGADHILIAQEGRRFAYGAAKYLPMTSSWLVSRRYMRDFPFNEQVYRREDKEWWHRRAHDAPRHRLPEFLIFYRVRFSSKSTQTSRPTRKMILSRLSTWPAMSLAILSASWLYHRLNRRTYYARHPAVPARNSWDGAPAQKLDDFALRGQQP